VGKYSNGSSPDWSSPRTSTLKSSGISIRAVLNYLWIKEEET
jgi:hypothetical protein